MKKFSALLIGGLFSLCATTQVQAFAQSVHKKMVIDAVKYMQQNPDSTNYNKLKAAMNASGISMDEAADLIGQAAYDVDDFNDVFFCGNVTGYCTGSMLGSAGESIVRYTSYHHFQNHSHANDEHGNDLGGYDLRHNPIPGLVDNAVKALAYGNYMDDGRGGLQGGFGWWKFDRTKYDTYNTTEKNYRLDGYSNKNMYKRFETTPFQPLDNLGQYWYQRFLAFPSLQTLGFALHTTDVLSPQHVWATSDHNHGPWELWGQFFYDSENLSDADNNYALVKQAMNYYTPINPSHRDIRPIITEGGAYAYAYGGQAMGSINHNDYVTVGRKLIPHGIALVVHILNHAAEQF